MEKENKYYVYFHFNIIKKEIFYVGKGYGRRASVKINRNKFWENTAKKYKYEILFPHINLTEQEAIELEIYYINHIGRRDLNKGTLVNLTNGGEGSSGYIMTDEHKQNIQKKLIGRVFSEEHIKNNIKSKIGKKRSKEICENISIGRKNRIITKEEREKLVLAGKMSIGRKHSSETKTKISKSNKNKTVSNETKELLKKRKECKKVFQFDLNDNYIKEYPSIKEASRVNNLDAATISRCCHNKKNTSGGFKWKFKD